MDRSDKATKSSKPTLGRAILMALQLTKKDQE